MVLRNAKHPIFLPLNASVNKRIGRKREILKQYDRQVRFS